jgi:hypothetical protein
MFASSREFPNQLVPGQKHIFCFSLKLQEAVKSRHSDCISLLFGKIEQCYIYLFMAPLPFQKIFFLVSLNNNQFVSVQQTHFTLSTSIPSRPLPYLSFESIGYVVAIVCFAPSPWSRRLAW